MNYAVIKPVDVANGPGVRVSLFVSGCTHHCKGCFNEETWDFGFGKPFDDTVRQELLALLNKPFIAGLSLLGGEPLEPENQAGVLSLLREVHRQFPEKSVWCYSGYTFEHIYDRMMADSVVTRELMEYLDVLVDGRFVASEKDLNLRFRGSKNQRILDVAKSLAAGQAVWCELFS